MLFRSLHMAQVVAIEYNLNYQKNQTSEEFKNNQMTYTYCRPELLQNYLSLGFEEMSVDEFESNKDLSNFGSVQWLTYTTSRSVHILHKVQTITSCVYISD